MAKPKRKMRSDPCWKGYEMAGMKKKDGKKVPNCIKSAHAKKKKSSA